MSRFRFKAWLESIGDAFWLRPAALVVLCLALAELALLADRRGFDGSDIGIGSWIYGGGEAGARSLLGAVASSAIGVAGTTFSITVAALSLASGQMGPRLLRNFVRDPGNQVALGIFLGTFAYSLVVLRTVRSVEEGTFVPHLAVSGALVLALGCVGTLVWFVHHVATGINVETVIDAVYRDLARVIARLPPAGEGRPAPAPPRRGAGRPAGFRSVRAQEEGYLASFERDDLADKAEREGLTIHLLVKPGDYIAFDRRLAELDGGNEETEAAIRKAVTVAPRPIAVQDVEYSVRQLVEVAVRALSPGISDPFTAAAVLDHLGGALGRLADHALPPGTVTRGGRTVLTYPATTYQGLCDLMLHLIRQNATRSPFVLIRLVEVLTIAARSERDPERLAVLDGHVELAWAAGQDCEEDARSTLETRRRLYREVRGPRAAA